MIRLHSAKIRLFALVAVVVALLPAMSVSSPLAARADSGAANQCPQIVQRAVASTAQLCDGTGRNQACYGHIALEAQPQPDVLDFTFALEGDRTHVSNLQSLRLSEMDLTTGAWGIALLRLQASLPDGAADNVTIVLFGDVALQNQTRAVTEIPVSTTNPAGVNIRSVPDAQASAVVMGRLSPGEPAFAVGRLADNSWLFIRHPLTGLTGWVAAPVVTVAGSLDTLAVVEQDAAYYGPMQAFTFQSAHDDAPCAEAPESGLIIQTPEGGAKVTFLINEVDIQLGSTVYFTAAPAGDMVVRVVEGSARVSADGGAQFAPAGTEITLPLDANGLPAGPPSAPQAYDLDNVDMLPVNLLPRTVAIAPPLDPSVTIPAIPGVSPADPAGNGSGRQEGELPPGIVDNPGLDGEIPPGLGGEAPPGQTKKDKDG